jgi:hypothetical protein
MLSYIGLLAAFAIAGVHSSQAAPRQLVIVVAEGLSPQVLDLGTAYVKTAYGENTTVALDDFKARAGTATAGADTLQALKGILRAASDNGYKTGLVTTGDVATVAPRFYNVAANDGAAVAGALVNDTKFDFLAGGGRAGFTAQGSPGSKRTDAFDAAKTLAAAGGSAFFDVASMENEAKGKTLALQSDGELNYLIDRDVEQEASFSELVSLGLQTLSTGNAPFILVVHDTLINKALAARDTPALVEQFRELDGILADIQGFGEDAPDKFGIALISTGAASAPRFTTTLPNEQVNAFYIISALPMSYGRAGASLIGADEKKLTSFATETYKGWQLSPENRVAVLAGTMTPEAAIRASYEPALKIAYEPIAAAPMSWTVGFDGGPNIALALQAIAATAPVK